MLKKRGWGQNINHKVTQPTASLPPRVILMNHNKPYQLARATFVWSRLRLRVQLSCRLKIEKVAQLWLCWTTCAVLYFTLTVTDTNYLKFCSGMLGPKINLFFNQGCGTIFINPLYGELA